MSDNDDDEACLGSIGFMFDAQHVRFTKKFCFRDLISLQIRMIGEDPGHVQSGQYLWPAATSMGHYLLDNWATLKSSSILELGAGVGLAGILASKLPGAKRVVLTDYDHGSLQLLQENAELNSAVNDTCEVSIEFLEWGKTLVSDDKGCVSCVSCHKFDGNCEMIGTKLVTFSLVIGTDLLYCNEIVEPLFSSVKMLMCRAKSSCFVLVSSFDPGEDIESAIIVFCNKIGLMMEEIVKLDEARKICRVQYFRHRDEL